MRRPISLLVSAFFAVTLLAVPSAIISSPVSAAPIASAPTVYCGDPTTDGSVDTGAGTTITCDTQVTNTITGIDPVTDGSVRATQRRRASACGNLEEGETGGDRSGRGGAETQASAR